jgi:CBS domain-containing protein
MLWQCEIGEAIMPNRPVRECIKRDKPLVGAAEESVQAVAMRMAEACCSSILICKEGRLNGIFTERDLLVRVVAAGLDPATTPVGAVMTRDPDRIDAKTPVVEAIRRMDEGSFRHMPVVQGDRIIGVISWRDLPFEERAGMQSELDQRHQLAERMW